MKKNVGVVQRTSDVGDGVVRIFLYVPYLLALSIAIEDGGRDSYGVLLILTVVAAYYEVLAILANKNNHIEIGEGKIVTVRVEVKLDRYGHPSGVKQRMEEEFMAENVEEIYSTKKLYRRFLWKESYGGRAYPEEISFKLKNGANVIKDFRCFSFGDSRKIFQYIYHRSGEIPEKSVREKRNKSLSSIIEKDYPVMKKYTYYFS